jgi:hypothetical protein
MNGLSDNASKLQALSSPAINTGQNMNRPIDLPFWSG